MFATWFGSETILGASSEFVEKGIMGIIEEPLGAALCLLLLGMFFAKKFYRLNIITLGDFYRIHFGKKVEVFSSIFMILSFLGYVAAQLVALSIVLQTVSGWNIQACMWAGATIVLIYTYIGGMWAISITDFVQTMMIVAGMMFLAWNLSEKVDQSSSIFDNLPNHFFDILPENNWKSISHYIAAWITIGLGSIPSQDVFQRVMSAKSEKIAIWASYLGAFLYLSVAILPLLIILFIRKLYPELVLGDAQFALPKMVMLHSNIFMQISFFGALLSAIMSTTSSAILAPASILAENLLKPLLHKFHIPLLVLVRISVVFITLTATIISTIKNNIHDLVSGSSALTLVVFFVPLLAGLYLKKNTSLSAFLSMIFGLLTYFFAEYQEFEIPSVLIGLLASFLGMFLGNLIDLNKRISTK